MLQTPKSSLTRTGLRSRNSALAGVIPGLRGFSGVSGCLTQLARPPYVHDFAWFGRASSGVVHRLSNVRQSVFQREFPNHTQHLVMN